MHSSRSNSQSELNEQSLCNMTVTREIVSIGKCALNKFCRYEDITGTRLQFQLVGFVSDFNIQTKTLF